MSERFQSINIAGIMAFYDCQILYVYAYKVHQTNTTLNHLLRGHKKKTNPAAPHKIAPVVPNKFHTALM